MNKTFRTKLASETFTAFDAGPATDEERWRAVSVRDRSSDGRFVYAVRSTGIYCRPSCPSRRPGRHLVTFFPGPNEAEGSGYRPCKRCLPRAGRVVDPWIDKIRRACVYLSNVEGHPSLTTLAARIGGSPYHLQRTFKRFVGLTPRQYAEACRMRKVRGALRNAASVTEAVFDAGYGSSSRFYERAAPKLGMPAAAYHKGGAGMTIRYAIVDSPLGRLLVAATSKGVCAIAIGSNDADLRRALTGEYPAASVAEDRRALKATAGLMIDHLRGQRPTLDLPLDVQATAFQWQVWTALAAIPYGETRTYAQVAAQIGRAGAARAVARACATNPVALAIPCHRVVPAGGGIGGYRWGVTRKRALLTRERRSKADAV